MREPKQFESPEAENFPAAVVFADISGFTSLAEQLAKQGPVGPERLSELLNAYFQPLIEIIVNHGGDVVKFAGDALLAVWRDEGEGLEKTTCRAAQCALDIQKHLVDYNALGITRLSLHIGVGSGEVIGMHVGGLQGRLHYVLGGTPLDQVAVAVREAQPGDVVLSKEACKLLSLHCAQTPVGYGCAKIRTILLPIPPKKSNMVLVPADKYAAFRAYIPDCILSRKGDASWLAELRRVTALFLRMPDLDHGSPNVLEQMQRRMRPLQRILERYEGTIKEFIVDDKGPTLIALFGLPPLAHEDDPVRAIQAALEIQLAFREQRMESNIGIASGRCFCGIIGGGQRREYTAIGEVMNVAARLMQTSVESAILCDEETYQLSETKFEFTHQSLIVKGKVDALSAHQPVKERVRSRQTWEIKGRVQERKELGQRLEDLVRGRSSTIILEGEPGIGKSRLVNSLIEYGTGRGVRTLVGAGDAIEKSSAYHAWVPIFNDLFGLKGVTELAERRRRVLDRLETDSNFSRIAPLLNAVLPLELPDNEITAQMTGLIRAESTRNLLVNLLSKSSPLLVVLEDAHWMDTSSWELAKSATKRVSPLMLVVVTRPMGTEPSASSKELVQASETVRLRLGPMDVGDTAEIVRELLGVSNLEQPVARVIHERAEGNPFFSQEIALAMRDAALIEIIGGVCRMASGISDLRGTNFPITLQGVVASRIDRLTPSQQLTLKVASVIGREFDLRLLSDIHPGESERSQLLEELDYLQQADLILHEKPEPYSKYLFKHAITQDVTYNLLLFSQRRQLHRSVAEFYEREQGSDTLTRYTLLAYHWGRAEDNARTLDYTEKAAEESFRTGTLNEAVEFFRDALMLLDRVKALDEIDKETRIPRRRSRALEGLGDAYFEKGQNRTALPYYDEVLRLFHIGPDKARVLRKSAECRMRLNEPSRAVELLDKAEQCEGVSQVEMGRIRLAGSDLAYFEGFYDEAENFLVQAENLFEESRQDAEFSRALMKHVTFKNLTGSPAAALPLVERAKNILRDFRNPRFDLLVAEAMAVTYEMLGQAETSLKYATEEAEIAERAGDYESLTEAHCIKARLHYFDGSFELAMNEARIAVDCSLKSEFFPDIPYAKTLLALCEIRLGNLMEGQELIDEARARSSSAGDDSILPWLAGWTDLAKAELHAARNQWVECNERFAQSLTIFQKFGRHWNVAMVRTWFGQALVKQGLNSAGREQFLQASLVWERLGNAYQARRTRELASPHS